MSSESSESYGNRWNRTGNPLKFLANLFDLKLERVLLHKLKNGHIGHIFLVPGFAHRSFTIFISLSLISFWSFRAFGALSGSPLPAARRHLASSRVSISTKVEPSWPRDTFRHSNAGLALAWIILTHPEPRFAMVLLWFCLDPGWLFTQAGVRSWILVASNATNLLSQAQQILRSNSVSVWTLNILHGTSVIHVMHISAYFSVPWWSPRSPVPWWSPRSPPALDVVLFSPYFLSRCLSFHLYFQQDWNLQLVPTCPKEYVFALPCSCSFKVCPPLFHLESTKSSEPFFRSSLISLISLFL